MGRKRVVSCSDGQPSQKKSKSPKRNSQRKTKSPVVWTIPWTESRTESLISHYRTTECLWNLRSEDYRNTTLKRANISTWLEQELILVPLVEPTDEDSRLHRLKMTELVDEVERKFKSLRTSFQTELKKVPERRSGAGAEDVFDNSSNWIFFKQLFFLKEVMALTAKQTSNSFDCTNPFSTTLTIESHRNSEEDISAVVQEQRSALIIDDELRPVTPVPSTSSAGNNKTPNVQTQLPGSSQGKGQENLVRLKCMEKCLAIIDEKEDGTDYFFKYCASMAKTMTELTRNEYIKDCQLLTTQYLKNPKD